MSESKTVKPFALWLQEQPGALHAELSEKLQLLTSKVMQHRKDGTLTLSIKIGQMSNAESHVMTTATQVKLVLPEADRARGIFFADDNGNLHRDDPRQMVFKPLAEAPTVEIDGELKTVDLETGELKEVGS